jgi:HK97 family phage prohead protease
MKFKSTVEAPGRIVVPFQVKADSIDEKSRTFEGLANTWALDLGQDVVHQGAFLNTLKSWKKSGDAMPLLNSHDHWNIMSALGQMLDAKETKEGLWTQWEIVEGEDGDKTLIRLRPSKRTGRAVVGKMSIGYEPVKWEMEQPEGTSSYWDQVRHLNEVNLKEVSLVLFPMNPGASIDATTVKHFLRDANAIDPKSVDGMMKHELRRLASRIGTLLKTSSKPADDDETLTPDEKDSKKDCTTCDGSGTVPDPDNPDAMMTCPTCDGTGTMPKKKTAETPTPTPTPTPAPTPTPTPTPPAPRAASEKVDDDETVIDALAEKPEPEVPTVQVYEYSEALQQRLKKVSLRSKMSSVVNS